MEFKKCGDISQRSISEEALLRAAQDPVFNDFQNRCLKARAVAEAGIRKVHRRKKKGAAEEVAEATSAVEDETSEDDAPLVTPHKPATRRWQKKQNRASTNAPTA